MDAILCSLLPPTEMDFECEDGSPRSRASSRRTSKGLAVRFMDKVKVVVYERSSSSLSSRASQSDAGEVEDDGAAAEPASPDVVLEQDLSPEHDGRPRMRPRSLSPRALRATEFPSAADSLGRVSRWLRAQPGPPPAAPAEEEDPETRIDAFLLDEAAPAAPCHPHHRRSHDVFVAPAHPASPPRAASPPRPASPPRIPGLGLSPPPSLTDSTCSSASSSRRSSATAGAVDIAAGSAVSAAQALRAAYALHPTPEQTTREQLAWIGRLAARLRRRSDPAASKSPQSDGSPRGAFLPEIASARSSRSNSLSSPSSLHQASPSSAPVPTITL